MKLKESGTAKLCALQPETPPCVSFCVSLFLICKVRMDLCPGGILLTVKGYGHLVKAW